MADVKLSNDCIIQESSVLTAGHSMNTFEVDGVKFGLGICYDAFFNELSTLYRKQGNVFY